MLSHKQQVVEVYHIDLLLTIRMFNSGDGSLLEERNVYEWGVPRRLENQHVVIDSPS